jgi:leucyl/phenylalanyl-tRNA--protein transferase
MVLFTDELRVSRSLRRRGRAIASGPHTTLHLDRDFVGTMRACAAPRAEQPGTWITDEIIDSYAELHRHGLAHSVELWSDEACIGGLYGVALGRMFYGESMFSLVRDASKITLVALVRLLRNEQVPVIDCQQKTAHLASLGAREIRRSDFCATVAQAVEAPSIDWSRYADRPLNELLLTN